MERRLPFMPPGSDIVGWTAAPSMRSNQACTLTAQGLIGRLDGQAVHLTRSTLAGQAVLIRLTARACPR